MTAGIIDTIATYDVTAFFVALLYKSIGRTANNHKKLIFIYLLYSVGNYSLIEPARPPGVRSAIDRLGPRREEGAEEEEESALPPPPEEPRQESAWERGLRQAREVS